MVRKRNTYHSETVTISERGPSNMVIYRNHTKSITSSIFYITMLGKGFPEHGYSETPIQIIISKTNMSASQGTIKYS